jgi:phospholipase C
MAQINRRRLLQGAAATAALTALGGPALLAQTRGAAPAKLTDIDHIIVLMKENRSFDHYFGTLSGVRGFDDPAALVQADGRPIFHQANPGYPGGDVLPFHLDTTKTNAQRMISLSHDWSILHASWNGGLMNRWIPAHRASKKKKEFAPLVMGYHTRQDIPFYYALAEAFTICDGYYCSVMGPTHPNRFYLMTGTIDAVGAHGGPAINNDGRRYSWETYPERLERAGISWRVYYDAANTGFNMCKFFTQYQTAEATSPLVENGLTRRPDKTLLADLRSGNIPQVTWILPPSAASEHPDKLPAAGEHHTRQILEALWSNPALWARTALILNYDENDGFFDHVAPPTPEPGTPGEFVKGLPIGLGFRVPCLVISPMSRGGYVCGETFDHTSVLRLIEARFGVEAPNISAWRRQTCGDLTRAFGFGEPARLDVPQLPETAKALKTAQQNAKILPSPEAPARPVMPRQESGARPRRV